MRRKVTIDIYTELGETLEKLRQVRDAIREIHEKVIESREGGAA